MIRMVKARLLRPSYVLIRTLENKKRATFGQPLVLFLVYILMTLSVLPRRLLRLWTEGDCNCVREGRCCPLREHFQLVNVASKQYDANMATIQ